MNILYLTTHLNIGGITSYVLTLAGGLKKKGHNIYVASSGGNMVRHFSDKGITYIHIPIDTKAEASPKVLISLFQLLGHIRANNIDILHANTRVTQVLACLAQEFSSRPFVSTCHGFFKKRFFRRIFPCWGQKVIAISEQVRGHLVNDFGIKESDIRVIHNGIDLNRFQQHEPGYRRRAKKNLGLSDGPVVGIIARLSDVKGHVYLIEAMTQVLKEIPAAQLLIIGDGDMKEELACRVNHLGIQGAVIFKPAVAETERLLSIMDVFVMPSLQEGLGLALMEAMASGLAVIGSDVGGIRGLIQDGLNGILVKPADIQGLSCAILGLLKDAKKREAQGRNARAFIAENFPREKMVQDTEGVYLECLNPKS